MTTSQRIAGIAFFLLLLLSMWTPGGDPLLPGWLEPLRYAVFIALSLAIIGSSYLAVGLRAPTGSEAAFIAAFLFYVSLSALWATPDVDTYIKSLLILSALMTSLGVANLLGLDAILRIIFSALATFVILCVLVALLIPSFGVETGWEHAGKWRGLAGQKNGLGAYSALTLVGALALPLKRRATPSAQTRALAGRIAVVLIAALSVYMAGSRGGQLVSVVGIASVVLAQAPKLLQRLILLSIALFCVPLVNLAVSTFWIDVDKIGVVGLTIDTNSRTKIWEYGLENMAGRELFGFGVNGFWTPERMLAFKDVHGWVLDNFHNGYITVFVEGGLVGLALFLLGLGLVYLLLVIAIGTLKDRFLALTFAYMNMFCVSNLVENEAGRSTSLSIFMFAILAFSIRPWVMQRVRPAPRPSPAFAMR